MVRVKHRWLCVQLDCDRDLDSVSKEMIASSLKDTVASVLGEVGTAKLTQMLSVEYFQPSIKIICLKVAYAHHHELRAAIVFWTVLQSRRGDRLLPIRPRVISSSATLVQTRRFLIDHLHRQAAAAFQSQPRMLAEQNADSNADKIETFQQDICDIFQAEPLR